MREKIQWGYPPFKIDEHLMRVTDSQNHFVFQFGCLNNVTKRAIFNKIVDKSNSPVLKTLSYLNGDIVDPDNNLIIRIRGWGGLIGTGGHNLSNKEAAVIQDEFAYELLKILNNE